MRSNAQKFLRLSLATAKWILQVVYLTRPYNPPPPTLPGKVKGWILWKLWSFLSKLFKTLCQTYFMGKHSPFFLSTRYSKSIGQGSLVSYHWVMKLVKMDLVLIKMELRHQQLILSTNLSNDYNSSLGNAVLLYDVKIKWANGNHRFW